MTNPGTLRILGVSGSLRQRSYNAALLDAAIDLTPAGAEMIRFAGLDAMPHFSEDLEAQSHPCVEAWRAALHDTDALLIATPEYNAGLPGALKNAIDWASRGTATPLRALPIALMGATPGGLGTIRAQLHLRDVLASIGAHVLPAPDVVVARAHERFDADLRLVDESTRSLVGRTLDRLAALTRLLARAKEAA
jgi:chromate reductase, NAD(P)H dehydrogenase (quinone)